MSTRKPETTYRTSIEKKLPKSIHHEKMCNPFSSGTADSWYSANPRDLWVEYKYVKKLPVRANVKIDLSAQQQDWLKGRHAEGRAVAVIVGSPEGGFVLEGAEWERYINTGIPVSLFRLSARDKAGIAEWICAQVLV